jgi:hypothetical protein
MPLSLDLLILQSLFHLLNGEEMIMAIGKPFIPGLPEDVQRLLRMALFVQSDPLKEKDIVIVGMIPENIFHQEQSFLHIDLCLKF